jgi:hypothetical protein
MQAAARRYEKLCATSSFKASILAQEKNYPT